MFLIGNEVNTNIEIPLITSVILTVIIKNSYSMLICMLLTMSVKVLLSWIGLKIAHGIKTFKIRQCLLIIMLCLILYRNQSNKNKCIFFICVHI